MLVLRSSASVPPLSRWPSRSALPQALTRSLSPGLSSDVQCRVEPAIAAKGAAQRAAEDRPAMRVDADPIAVDRQVDRALGPIIGMRVPGDVAEQAGRQPQPLHVGAVVRKQRVHPLVEIGAMVAEPAEPVADLQRRRQQRILAPGRFVEVAVEQSFAQAEGRNDDPPRPELVEHAPRARSRPPAGSAGATRKCR